MITGELKNKIDALWDLFAAGGLVNPLEVIEQITYLIKRINNKNGKFYNDRHIWDAICRVERGKV